MKIVMLAGRGTSTNIAFHALNARFPIEKVILEESVPKGVLLRKRVKKLGIVTVAGQLLFKLLVETALSAVSGHRIREILEAYRLNDSEIDADKIICVDSVNSAACIALLRETRPDIVVVNGTRIISEEVLSCIDTRFINMHAGITPKYRGVHGAYWALVNRDDENCGVTVHFADKGIDTGAIIYQAKIDVTKKDNFLTYPLLQTAVGVVLEGRAVSDILDGTVQTRTNSLESRLWSHPTLWGYLKNRIRYGVK